MVITQMYPIILYLNIYLIYTIRGYNPDTPAHKTHVLLLPAAVFFANRGSDQPAVASLKSSRSTASLAMVKQAGGRSHSKW